MIKQKKMMWDQLPTEGKLEYLKDRPDFGFEFIITSLVGLASVVCALFATVIYFPYLEETGMERAAQVSSDLFYISRTFAILCAIAYVIFIGHAIWYHGVTLNNMKKKYLVKNGKS